MHHPLIDIKELRKLPDEKVQEQITQLNKKRSMIMKTNQNPELLQQVESLLTTYQLELSDRTARRIAKEKNKGTDLDDLINVE
jgi:superfamily II RNA helicase|tara:strand:+ start:35 stop:283 length:249 start_codon:yes stop_codon:yes gene_type:complete